MLSAGNANEPPAPKGGSMGYRARGFRLSGFLLMSVVLAPLAARAETLDQLYEKAKAEGALTIYTGAGPSAAKAGADAFEKRFPGIKVTAKGGFSNVLDLEIDQQLKDKKVTTDYVQFQTIQDYRRWDKAGALQHYKPEGFEQVFPSMKDKNGAWVAVNAIPIFYGYNPEKVKDADVPKSALDFLDPRFRHQLVTAYPTDDDATLYDFYLITQRYGWDYMKKYMANEPYFIQGHRDVALRVKTGDNPLSFDLDYQFAELSATYQKFGLGVGIEILEGNGAKGFTTPLATLHKFQGWADKFLTTPPNGIEDSYVKAMVNLKAVGGLETLGFVLGYHDYEAEHISADYGSEVNLSVAAKLKKLNVMLKYADFQEGVLASARDTEKYWLQAEFVW